MAGVYGGAGLQLPATFKDPSNVYGVPGPDGTAHWVGGGGASGSWDTSPWGVGGLNGWWNWTLLWWRKWWFT